MLLAKSPGHLDTHGPGYLTVKTPARRWIQSTAAGRLDNRLWELTLAMLDSIQRTTSWSITAGSLPLIIAHRGHQSAAPENTLSAFQGALAAGADGIELDVRLTRDGQLVVFHDRHLDRTSNGHGLVNHHTLSEICTLNQSQGGNYILERWQRHGRCKHQCVGSGL